MFVRPKIFHGIVLLALLIVVCKGRDATAQDTVWRVGKSSGEVWISKVGVQKIAVTDQTIVQPGDNIRTGQTGRVLLMRGDESILISPNSIIGVPSETKQGMSTIITQQAGSILLEVEKRNVNHFEVETPLLAAVVKGTNFRVTVAHDHSRVDVFRGQVEVSDFKSGQYALITSGQTATVSTAGPSGLSLGGSGTLGPIYHGATRRSSVIPILGFEEGIRTRSRKLSPSQSHAAVPPDAIESFIASSQLNIDWDMGAGSLIGKASMRWPRTDEIISALSIPLSVGSFVALAVGVARRRRKKKHTRN